MKLTKEARHLARQMFRSSLIDDRIDPETVRALAGAVIRRKPRNFIAVLKEYARLVRLEMAKYHATIETAVKLPDAVCAGIVHHVHAKYGEDVTTNFRVNNDLIGGIRIRIGSDVWDGSIKERLERLGREFGGQVR